MATDLDREEAVRSPKRAGRVGGRGGLGIALFGRAAPPSLGDPAKKGSHVVKTIVYGAGNDRYRPDFGKGVALQTTPVDASKVRKGWSGVTGWARTRFWGFDAKALPLNGRVWYPEGNGPFPLVLIVHGNHLSADFSVPDTNTWTSYWPVGVTSSCRSTRTF